MKFKYISCRSCRAKAIVSKTKSSRRMLPSKLLVSRDGGGMRGYISSLLDDKVYRLTGKHIKDVADAHTGASTGAIGAAASAIGYDGATIAETYRTDGPRIFEPSAVERAFQVVTRYRKPLLFGAFATGIAAKWGARYVPRLATWSRALYRTSAVLTALPILAEAYSPVRHLMIRKYNSTNISSVLQRHFADTTFGQIHDTRHNDLLIPVLNPNGIGGVQTLDPLRDTDMPIWNAVKASTSAPSFFEATSLPGYNDQVFCDPGVTQNSPCFSSYYWMRDRYPDHTIKVLSLGTGMFDYNFSFFDFKKGAAFWGINFVHLTISMNTRRSKELLRERLCANHFVSLEPRVPSEMEPRIRLDGIDQGSFDVMTDIVDTYWDGLSDDTIRQIGRLMDSEFA